MKLKEIGAKNDMPKGWIKQSEFNRRLYIRWKHMLERCYCPKFKRKYPTYKDCSCHPDFLIFSKFLAYLETLPTWNDFLNTWDTQQWHLDKDIIEPGNKCYTYGKISLVPAKDNILEATLRNMRNNRYDFRGMGKLGGDVRKNSPEFKEHLYSKENIEHCRKLAQKSSKPIIAFNLKDGSFKLYTSAAEVHRQEGYSASHIRNKCKVCGTFNNILWMFLYTYDREVVK